jgi:5'-3' exonuclease
MTNYILIDGSYFVFYRVFALQVWWKNVKPDEELINPFENMVFVEKYVSTFLSKIDELKRKLKMKDATLIVGVDCPQTQIWRKSFYPEYKVGRNQEKNKAANISKFFELTYREKLFEKAGVKHIVKLDHLEADDCLALTAKYLYNEYSDANITIITSDHDYIQLANDRIHLMNLKYVSLLDSKKYSGSPDRDLFYKIVLGDKSDNIEPLFSKCGPKTVEKYYDNQSLFLERLESENKRELYERNKRLIDFNEIPVHYVELFYNTILTRL